MSDATTVGLSVVLAFVFGYSLTSLPLLRAGFALGAVIPVALASDTIFIAVMELIDNAVVLAIPGAIDAGLGTLLFWGSLSFALAVAFVVEVPVSRWLIAHSRGHAAVHRTGVHSGAPPKLVGAVLAVAFAFGTAVLIAEALDGDRRPARPRGRQSRTEPAERRPTSPPGPRSPPRPNVAALALQPAPAKALSTGC